MLAVILKIPSGLERKLKKPPWVNWALQKKHPKRVFVLVQYISGRASRKYLYFSTFKHTHTCVISWRSI